MTFAVILLGKVVDAPELATSSDTTKPAPARVRIAHAIGAQGPERGDEYPATVFAYGELREQLLQLARGDMVAITGRARVRAWTGPDNAPRSALSVIATAILTSHQGRRLRRFKAELDAAAEAPESPPAGQDA